jgi:hypothetical protein
MELVTDEISPNHRKWSEEFGATHPILWTIVDLDELNT